MHKFLIRGPAIAVVGLGLLLGGCATRESVENAQSTADTAKDNAAAAMAAAQKAQSAADAADQAAQQAMAAAQEANGKIDKMAAERSERRHVIRRHHRKHHTKHAQLDNHACLPQHG